MKFLIGAVTIICACLSVYAGGQFSFSGKLRNFDENTVDVQDAKKIYTIDRAKLGTVQNQKISKLKSGEIVFLEVPFDSLKNVKPLKQ